MTPAEKTLIYGRCVITDARSDPPFLENAGVVVVGDTIIAGGHTDALRRRYAPSREIGGDQFLVMPGMVNGHHHGRGLSAFQGGACDDCLEAWIYDIWTEPPSDVYLNTLHGALRLVASGVTTVIHSHYHSPVEPQTYVETAQTMLRAYEDARIRVRIALGIKDRNLLVHGDQDIFIAGLPQALQDDARWMVDSDIKPETYFAHFAALYEQYAGHSHIGICLGPEGIQWCSDGLLRRIAETAAEYNVGIHLHALESPYQNAFDQREYGEDSVIHLDKIDFWSPRVSCAHAVWMSEEGARVFAHRGATVIPNPSSNFRLRSGIAPVAYLRQMGVRVGLGLDGTGINDDDDMLQEARLAHLVNQLPLLDAPRLDTRDVLEMMTYGSARAALLDDAVGSLSEGRKADIVLLRFDEICFPYTHPRHNPIDILLYRGRARHVDTVIIGGDLVYANGRFINYDLREIGRRLAASVRTMEPDSRFSRTAKALKEHAMNFYRQWDMPHTDPFYHLNSSV
jgi:5-methylthioadenosine/S-adenosylhomocysteine deaminase